MKNIVNQNRAATLYRPAVGLSFAGLAVAGLVSAWTISIAQSYAAQPPAENRPVESQPSPEREFSAERVEQIVHDYLMREPQVIYDALEELQRREQAEKLEKMNLAVLENRDALYNNPASPIGGNPDGDVTLVEFFDYRCGYCRHVMPSIEALLKQDKGIKLVFKDLPILGEDSERAARAALASREQGVYERFHFVLMQADDLSEAGIVQLAEANGLDAERLLKDMNSPEVSRTIEENRKLADEIGIDGTPMFIINDKVIPGAAELEQLQALVEEARDA